MDRYELLRKFKNGRELYETSPIFRVAFDRIRRGERIHHILEDVIVEAEALAESCEAMIKNGTIKPAPILVIPKEILPPAHDSADSLIALLANMFDVHLDEHEKAEEIRETIALNIQGFRA
jgi:hypothetical protein